MRPINTFVVYMYTYTHLKNTSCKKKDILSFYIIHVN